MALDPSLNAAACADLAVAAAQTIGGRPATVACVDPPVTLVQVHAGVSMPSQTPVWSAGVQSIYDYLENRGIVALGSAPHASDDSRIHMAGGSVCSTSLVLEHGHWIVEKVARPSPLDRRDSFDRHWAEMQWLAALSATENVKCFPSTVGVDPTIGFPWIRQEFVPRYTLGERTVQGRESLTSLCWTVEDAFGVLKEQLYSRKNNRRQDTYVGIVARRMAKLRHVPFYRALWNDGIAINDVGIPALKAMLCRLSESQEFLAVVRPVGGFECHGDLILEDILPPSACDPGEIMFVDPNPQNASPFIDLAKLAMNGITCYDMAFRDLIEISLDEAGSLPSMRIVLKHPMSSMFLDFAEWIRNRGVVLLGTGLASHVGLNDASLYAQAALQALALPAFHVLHHGAIDRGQYFAAVGMLALYEALERPGESFRPPFWVEG